MSTADTDAQDHYEFRPVKESLKNLKPVGWYAPGEVSHIFRGDGTIEIRGNLHLFKDDEHLK